jgi:hypothetical protein
MDVELESKNQGKEQGIREGMHHKRQVKPARATARVRPYYTR